MPQQTTTPQPPIEVLLKEYELCMSDAHQIEQYIWTAAGLVITASLAGIGFIGGSLPATPNLYDYLIRILVSVLSISFVWIWRITAERWYAVQEIMYYRAREIEEGLGIYKNRYVTNLYRAISKKNYDHDENIDLLVTTFKTKHKPNTVRRSVNQIANILTIVWLLTLALQIAAVFGWI